MKNLPRTIRLALAGLLLASTLAAGTLERARQLLDAGDLEGASREAAAAVAAAEGEERAAALDLVGAIAVEARRWEEARAAWTRLADEHPASPLAEQARTKLALLEALSATDPDREGDRDEPGAPQPAAAPRPSASPPAAEPAEPPADLDDAAAAAAAVAAPPVAAPSAAGPAEAKAPEAVGRPAGAVPAATPPPPPAAAPAAVPGPGGNRDDPAAAPVSPAAEGEGGSVEGPETPESAGREPGATPGSPVLAEPPAPPPSPKAPEAVGRPAGAVAPGAPAPPAPAPGAPEEPPPAATPPPPRAGTAVFIAGDGKPRKHFQEAAEQVMEFLAERGVAVRVAPDGLAMFQDARAALPRFLAATREAGAASLIYFEAQFGHREKIEIDCLTPDGAGLWSEQVTGGLGLSDRKVNKRLMRRFLEKLEPRVGGPGLPVQ